jgi:hypothetical protein
MALETLAGKVDKLHQSTETSGHIAGNRGYVSGNVSSQQVMSFRLDGKPVQLKLKNAFGLSDGDDVAVSGKSKNGTLHALAVFNASTGASDSQPTTLLTVVGSLLFVLGIPLSFLIIGIPILLLGGVVAYQGYRNTQAVKLLEGLQIRAGNPVEAR